MATLQQLFPELRRHEKHILENIEVEQQYAAYLDAQRSEVEAYRKV